MKFRFTYEIKDLSEEAKQASHQQLLNGLVRCGMKMQEYATKLAPVKTGALANSVAFKIEPDEKSAYVGSNSEYAAYVEFGTGKYSELGGTPKERWVYYDKAHDVFRMGYPQKPRPFIRPAVANHIKTYQNILVNALKGKTE